jgi:CHAT domain-containing protein/tetratricopeptide (TPR) repeat protein
MFKTMEGGRRSRLVVQRLKILVLLASLHACSTGAGVDRELDRLFESARLAMWQGQLAEARDLAERGLEVARGRPDSHRSWTLQLLLCEILLNRLEFSRASAFLATEVPAGSSFDDLRVRQQYLRAKALVAEGKLAEALVSLDAIKATPAAEEVQLDAEILGGQARLRLGQWDEAERRLGSVLKRTGEINDRHRTALALNNLGMGRLVRGRYDEALAWFERLLSYTDLEEMAVYGTALYNAGICYSRVGEFERATKAQLRAVNIYDRRGPSLQLVQSLGSLGNTYVLAGDAPSALPFLQRAMNVSIAAKLPDESALWAGNLATAHAELGEWSEAERFNDEAVRLGRAGRSVKPVYFTLNAARIALGRADFERARTLFEHALTASEGTPAVIWSAHAGLARVATAEGQPERAARHFEAALQTIETTRSSLLKTEFRLSFLTQLIEFYQVYVDALVGQNRIERALEISESSRGRVLAERHGVQTPDVVHASALRRLAQRSGTVLMSYWLAPARSSLWIVDADAIRYVPLPPAGEIESLVRQHQAMIHNALADPLAMTGTPGDRLYELLVEPAARWIKPGSTVLIAPDGALHRLNFETLPVKGPRKRYWIEDAEIQIAPSLAMLTAERKAAVDARTVLIIGDPVARAPEFPPLRYASAEMANVSKHFPADKVVTYRSDRAIPEAYRAARPDRFGMIHFTAHAVANPESPLDSAIMLSGPDHGFKLYARDVADQPLTAELVTVSACRSAGERTYSGEGLVGFAWAFLRAGARRVIAGLWDVDDRSTADLMDQVYARIASGVPPSRALREAKLEVLRKGGTAARPYYWAPFEVFTLTTAN